MDVTASDVPPERARLDFVRHIKFDGVSAALLPNGSLVCGAAADAALDRIQPAGGLVLVHSHRQRIADFRDHARALGLQSRGGRGLLDSGTWSVLLVNNNAPLLYQRASYGRSVNWGPHADDAVAWMRAYGLLPLQIRLLITTSLNVGYFCGEVVQPTQGHRTRSTPLDLELAAELETSRRTAVVPDSPTGPTIVRPLVSRAVCVTVCKCKPAAASARGRLARHRAIPVGTRLLGPRRAPHTRRYSPPP